MALLAPRRHQVGTHPARAQGWCSLDRHHVIAASRGVCSHRCHSLDAGVVSDVFYEIKAAFW